VSGGSSIGEPPFYLAQRSAIRECRYQSSLIAARVAAMI